MSSQQECALSQPPKNKLSLSELLLRRLLRRRPHVTASLLASIVESSDDGIYSIDLDGIITSWNKGAEQLFGYTANEAVGRPVTMLISLDRKEIAVLERIKRGERIHNYETVRRRKDGSSVEISLTVSPIHTPKGNIIGASKIARDISDRKKSQQLIIGTTGVVPADSGFGRRDRLQAFRSPATRREVESSWQALASSGFGTVL
jgi:PAS domain S-box-containing protein